jgi:hypothetical protein
MKTIKIIIILVVSIQFLTAQSPMAFNFQGIARNDQRQLITNKNIALKFSIIDLDDNSTDYTETHSANTTETGTFALMIGTGNAGNGDISNLNWGTKQYALRVEMDHSGGNNFIQMGTSALVSVPYALHAETVTDKDDADADPTNELQTIVKTGSIVTLSDGGSFVDDDEDADADPMNELQVLSFDPTTNQLSLSSGGVVDLSVLDNDNGGQSGTDDQQLFLTGTTLSIEDGNQVDLSPIRDGVEDADADPTNEIQTLQLTDDYLEISEGNGVNLGSLEDLDWRLDESGDFIFATSPMARVDNIETRNISVSDTNKIVEVSGSGLRVRDTMYREDAELNSSFLEFVSSSSKDTAIYSRNGIGLSSSFYFPTTSRYMAHSLLFEDFISKGEYFAGGLKYFASNADTFYTEMSAEHFEQVSKECFTRMDPGVVFLGIAGDNGIPFESALLRKDTLTFFKEGVGLLFHEISNLSSFALDFEFGTNTAEYGTFGMYQDDGIYNLSIGTQGIVHRQALSSVDVFKRFSLEPDSLLFFNDVKYKVVELGVNQQSKGGQLKLYDTMNNLNTSIITDQGGDATMEMNHQGDLRVWLGTFNEGGVINTVGQNGSMNTYLGRADFHTNGNFGGLGVMDDVSILQAGMEVMEDQTGVVYTTGSFKVIDQSNNELSKSDEFGYRLNNSNGNATLSLTSDIIDNNIGYLNIYGSNQGPNVFAGANFLYHGNGSTGQVTVQGTLGEDHAGMVVNSSNEGIVFSDHAFFGENPDGTSAYPVKIQQPPNYGLGLFRDDDNFYEYYINSNNNLALFYNNATIGYFEASTGNYVVTSDRRLKRNIRSLQSTLDKVSQLNPSKYSYIRTGSDTETIGFIAQEVEEVFPELVSTAEGKDGQEIKGVNYSGMSVIAIKAIQEQQTIIDNQEMRISELETQIAEIKALLSKK